MFPLFNVQETVGKIYTLLNNLQQAEQTSSDFIFKLLYLGCFVFEFQGTSFINYDQRKFHFPVWTLKSSFSSVSFFDRSLILCQNKLFTGTKNYSHYQAHKTLVYTSLYPHTAISINVVGSKHEAKRQDRKFTWDFYE